MTRAGWFHCFSGVAGDMALGALLDAGADVDEVRSLVERLPVRGWGLEAEAVTLLGETYLKMRDRPKAMAAFQRVLSDYPDSPFAVPASEFIAFLGGAARVGN